MTAKFTHDDLWNLLQLVPKVTELVREHGARMVVEIYDAADQQAVAWIEMHPSDSDSLATIRFAKQAES